MAENDKVASARTVVANPFVDDPNAGIIVAAGDPIPAGVGVISNTPNKVDAAANYDEVDAADKAGAGARPATTVVVEGTGPSQEIVDRVEANRNSWEQESQLLGKQAASPAARDASTSTTTTDSGVTLESVDSATGKQLDAAFGDVEGYPKSAKVDARQKWARAHLESQGA